MTPVTATEYFAKVRDRTTYSWLELSGDVQTLSAAQSYVEQSWKNVTEIGESVNGALIQVVSQKNADGTWKAAQANGGIKS